MADEIVLDASLEGAEVASIALPLPLQLLVSLSMPHQSVFDRRLIVAVRTLEHLVDRAVMLQHVSLKVVAKVR